MAKKLKEKDGHADMLTKLFLVLHFAAKNKVRSIFQACFQLFNRGTKFGFKKNFIFMGLEGKKTPKKAIFRATDFRPLQKKT